MVNGDRVWNYSCYQLFLLSPTRFIWLYSLYGALFLVCSKIATDLQDNFHIFFVKNRFFSNWKLQLSNLFQLSYSIELCGSKEDTVYQCCKTEILKMLLTSVAKLKFWKWYWTMIKKAFFCIKWYFCKTNTRILI